MKWFTCRNMENFFNDSKENEFSIKKSWVDPGQPSTSTEKRNIREKKILLGIW